MNYPLEPSASEMRDLVDGAVQVWYPKSCSGSFSANDAYTADIKDGPGLSYQSKSTVTGSAAIPEAQAAPWEAHTPSRSSATTSRSPRRPSKRMHEVFGSRSAPAPATSAPVLMPGGCASWPRTPAC